MLQIEARYRCFLKISLSIYLVLKVITQLVKNQIKITKKKDLELDITYYFHEIYTDIGMQIKVMKTKRKISKILRNFSFKLFTNSHIVLLVY